VVCEGFFDTFIMYKPSITGTNNIPLGKRRIGGGSNEEAEDLAENVEPSAGNSLKRAKEENDQQTGINLTRSSRTCSLLFSNTRLY
jgi:hypothetical protein